MKIDHYHMIESLDGNHVSFYITKKVFTYIPYVCNAAGTKQNTPNTSDKLSTFKAAMTTNQSRLAAKRGKEMKNRKKSLNQVRKRRQVPTRSLTPRKSLMATEEASCSHLAGPSRGPRRKAPAVH